MYWDRQECWEPGGGGSVSLYSFSFWSAAIASVVQSTHMHVFVRLSARVSAMSTILCCVSKPMAVIRCILWKTE